MKGQALQLEAFLTKSPAALTSIQFTHSGDGACEFSRSSEGGFKQKLTVNFPSGQKTKTLFVKCSSGTPTEGTISAVQVGEPWSYLNFLGKG